MNKDDINNYIPSILNPRSVKKGSVDLNLTQHSIASRCSLSLRRNKAGATCRASVKKIKSGKENRRSNQKTATHQVISSLKDISEILDLSAVEDFISFKNDNNQHFVDESLCDILPVKIEPNCTIDAKSDDTILYDIIEKPVVSISFSVTDCKSINVNAKNSNIKNFAVIQNANNTNIDCKIEEDDCVSVSSDDEVEIINNKMLPSPPKKQAVSVSLEIKRKKNLSTDNNIGDSILILNTNAIEKISHVIVQPPNYKFVKRKLPFRDKLKASACLPRLDQNNGKVVTCGTSLKQKSIVNYFHNNQLAETVTDNSEREHDNGHDGILTHDNVNDMHKNSGVNDIVIKSDKLRPNSFRVLQENDGVSRSKLYSPRRPIIHRPQDIKATSSELPRNSSPKIRNGSISSYSPRKNVESLHFSLPSKSRTKKVNVTQRDVPYFKIVAGTHFAVDAFSYGDIPNVNNYFLTHFHSDHYCGLNKNFSKTLYCSQITAELCTSRLGLNPKLIHTMNLNETIMVEGVEVTAVDANHCPGAIMLIFTLPNGKTLLHTGDFRASPAMESYPVFWNKDIHTVYLDTTYCNPRYDFPTQDQSLELALHLLRQKKSNLEEAGKKFSSVLIVCGTYTIGKEKFFTGVARRVGCTVWACPEKERVLRVVERNAQANRPPPQACQLHVVPMRDLTHEKLRAYLDSMQGAFSEVVAFKPSGWESGKETAVQKDLVTIHGIPYSEHSSFPEMVRFVTFLKPKQVIPTVDISGGIKAVQKYFPCPLIYKEDLKNQSRLTDYFNAQSRQQVPAVT